MLAKLGEHLVEGCTQLVTRSAIDLEIALGRRFEYWADGLPLLLVSRIDDALHVVYEALPIAEPLDRPVAELLYGATEEDPEHYANRQRSAE